MPIAMIADTPTAAVAIVPVHRPSQRRPNDTFMRNAASGSPGMSQAFAINSRYPFIWWSSSTLTVGRLRYAARMIARPTATSAAAMTNTNTTNTLPR